MSRRLRLTLLVAILALAGSLRFTALGWGLRHTPHADERYFVESVGWMLAEGDLDHRFYEYPGLFFYLLAPVLAPLGPPSFGPSAYLAARGLVAGFGVASVALAYVLGCRLAGPLAGLASALLLAVSPVEVHTAHMVRPDVALEFFALASLLVIDGLGEATKRARDAFAGALVGAATAVKFSGALLAPSYVTKRLLVGKAGWRALALAAAGGLVSFALFSPYSLLHLDAALEGFRTQVEHHYVERGRGAATYAGMAWTYGRILAKALGWPGLLLVAAGIADSRAGWRRRVPLLIFPLVTVAVFSTAEVQRDRFVVPALGVLAAFAGCGVAFVARHTPRGAMALAVLAPALPLVASLDYVRSIGRSSTSDMVLDWMQEHVPEGSLVLTSQRDLGLDRARYEVIAVERVDAGLRPLVSRADAIVTAPGEQTQALADLEPCFRAEPATPHSGFPLAVACRRARPAGESVPLRRQWISASENQELLAALLDGDPATEWRINGERQQPGSWIQVDFPEPTTLHGIELLLGSKPRHFAQNLHLLISRDGNSWHRLPVVQARPPVEEQLVTLKGASQVFAFGAVEVRGIRLLQVGRGRRPWGVAELKLEGVRGDEEPGPSPAPQSPRHSDGRAKRSGRSE